MNQQPNPWRRPSDEPPPKDGTKIDIWAFGDRYIDLWWQDECLDWQRNPEGPGWMGENAGPECDWTCQVLKPEDVDFWMPRPPNPEVGNES